MHGGRDDEAPRSMAEMVQEVRQLIHWYEQGVVTSEEALILLQQTYHVHQDQHSDGVSERSELVLQP